MNNKVMELGVWLILGAAAIVCVVLVVWSFLFRPDSSCQPASAEPVAIDDDFYSCKARVSAWADGHDFHLYTVQCGAKRNGSYAVCSVNIEVRGELVVVHCYDDGVELQLPGVVR